MKMSQNMRSEHRITSAEGPETALSSVKNYFPVPPALGILQGKMDLPICFPFFFVFQLLTYAVNRNLPSVSLRQRKCFLQFICLRCSAQLRCVGLEPHLPPPWLPEGRTGSPLVGMVLAIPQLPLCKQAARIRAALGALSCDMQPQTNRSGRILKKKRFGCSPGHEEPDLQLSQMMGALASTAPTDSWWELEPGWVFLGMDPRCYPQAVVQVPHSCSCSIIWPPHPKMSLL